MPHELENVTQIKILVPDTCYGY